ncbi:MAG: excinuclease ABC subunit C [Chitinophagaceae bacterium]|nr:excinuclease ABC subunit C [Chitinophagaceae bacterium]
MTSEAFQHIAGTIPSQPGIYKYFDAAGTLIYVGKAKNIRKRVSSYFNKTFTTYKTHELVQRIEKIEFTIVNSEQDAFLLENTLIKRFQPRYNINLKDDKTYPYLVIKNEPFPRVFLTRQKLEDGSQYLGPYTSVKKVRELLEFIRRTIPLRTCTLNLTDRNIEKKKFKVCLEYHLGNCKGPCEGLQPKADYEDNLQQVKNLLKGNLLPVIRHFREEMKTNAENLQFEKAEETRKKIDFLANYQSRSLVANSRTGDIDVFFLHHAPPENETSNGMAYVQYLMVSNGAIIQTHTSKVETHLEETPEEILVFTIAQLRSTFNSEAKELVVPLPITYPDNSITVTVPRSGDRKKLLELAEKNVEHYLQELREKERLRLNLKSADDLKALNQLKEDLQLQELPLHIECFDNSNFQGAYPVSAMVCFRNGVPDKKNYRHFNVKTVTGINDFATMKEAVLRRYKRLNEEGEAFPQLVVIDGGKGQLSAAMEAIDELQLRGEMTLVGLAKNEEELFFAGDQSSLKLPYNSDSLRLIRRIRDEVHRFGINFHRQKRSKGTFKNELEEIKGIGRNTADMLLKEFRSVKNVSEADLEKLTALVGAAKARLVYAHFNH